MRDISLYTLEGNCSCGGASLSVSEDVEAALELLEDVVLCEPLPGK